MTIVHVNSIHPTQAWYGLGKLSADANFYRRGLREEIQLEELPKHTNHGEAWGELVQRLQFIGLQSQKHTKPLLGECLMQLVDDCWMKKQRIILINLKEHSFAVMIVYNHHFLHLEEILRSFLASELGKRRLQKHAAQTLIEGKTTEPVSGWMIFETNQATNDHLDEPIECRLKHIETIKRGHTIIKSERIILLHFENQEKLPFFVNNSNQAMSLNAKD